MRVQTLSNKNIELLISVLDQKHRPQMRAVLQSVPPERQHDVFRKFLPVIIGAVK